jgi:Na+(H+)/acetate symporter ActP
MYIASYNALQFKLQHLCDVQSFQITLLALIQTVIMWEHKGEIIFYLINVTPCDFWGRVEGETITQIEDYLCLIISLITRLINILVCFGGAQIHFLAFKRAKFCPFPLSLVSG